MRSNTSLFFDHTWHQRDLEEREIIPFLWSITSKEKKVDNSIFQLVLIFTILKKCFFWTKNTEGPKISKTTTSSELFSMSF